MKKLSPTKDNLMRSGKPLDLKAFKNWLSMAEKMPAVSFEEVKKQWAKQKSQLLEHSNQKIKERKFGCAKGLVEMRPGFDEPLDDFKEYM